MNKQLKSFFLALLLVCTFLFQGFLASALANEIWVPPEKKDQNKVVGNWAVTNDGDAHFSFGLPDNMTDFLGAKVVVIGKKDKDITYDLHISVAQNMQRHDAISYSLSNLPDTLVKDELLEIDVSSVFPAPLYPGADYITLHFKADKKSEVRIIGLRFQYEGLPDEEIGAMGYIKNANETDQVFVASAAHGISAEDTTNWDTAHGWGDHSAAGYLTSYTETDPVFGAHAASEVTAAKLSNWDTAHGWGDHSTVGYLTSYTETDPTVDASVKDGVSWGELAGIPSVFADNIDNDSGGDITAVNAGTGLNGGGTSGDVTLNVDVPLFLIGSSGNPIVQGRNVHTGAGVFGHSENGFGVKGESTSNRGVFGNSVSGPGVYGHSGESYGVYGYSSEDTGIGVYGLNYENGNYGYLGGFTSAIHTGYGVYGRHYASGNYGYLGGETYSVYGLHSNGTYGYLGGRFLGVMGSTTDGYGVYGESSNSTGVFGWGTEGVRGHGGHTGVFGWGGDYGVAGSCVSGRGVYGDTGDGYGVYGTATTTGYAGYFDGKVHVTGTFTAAGTKNFIQPNAKDPSKEIVYIAAEGPEAMVFYRGTSRLDNGIALIELPEHFRGVAAQQGIQVQVTPLEECNGIYVATQSRERIEFKELMGGKHSARFNYFVTAVRAGFEDHQPVVANTHFKPKDDETATDFEARFRKADISTRAIRAMLISNGILTKVGKLNMAKVKELGWKVAEKDSSDDQIAKAEPSR